jgi:phosphoribosylformylglycinamidine (FGAM) synthase PurS component
MHKKIKIAKKTSCKNYNAKKELIIYNQLKKQFKENNFNYIDEITEDFIIYKLQQKKYYSMDLFKVSKKIIKKLCNDLLLNDFIELTSRY